MGCILVSNKIINTLIIGNTEERITVTNYLIDKSDSISDDIINYLQKILPIEMNLSVRINYLRLFEKLLKNNPEVLDFIITEFVKAGISITELELIIEISTNYLKINKSEINISKNLTLKIINIVRKFRNLQIKFDLLSKLYMNLFELSNHQAIMFFYNLYLIGSKSEKTIAKKYLEDEHSINLSQFSQDLTTEIDQQKAIVLGDSPINKRIKA